MKRLLSFILLTTLLIMHCSCHNQERNLLNQCKEQYQMIQKLDCLHYSYVTSIASDEETIVVQQGECWYSGNKWLNLVQQSDVENWIAEFEGDQYFRYSSDGEWIQTNDRIDTCPMYLFSPDWESVGFQISDINGQKITLDIPVLDQQNDAAAVMIANSWIFEFDNDNHLNSITLVIQYSLNEQTVTYESLVHFLYDEAVTEKLSDIYNQIYSD